MKQLQELQPLIIDWAKDKNIHLPEVAPKQRLKLIEECGELASAILKQNVELQKDAIGDIFVVLIILAKQTSSELNLDIFNVRNKNTDVDLIMQILYNAHKEVLESNNVLFLNDLSVTLNLDLTECANIAWNEIKNRKGNTVNGTFIKDK